MGGKDRAPICTWHVKPERQRHTSRETHDLHDRERERKLRLHVHLHVSLYKQ